MEVKPKIERRKKQKANGEHPRRRKTDVRKIKTSDAARRIKIARYLKASVYNALKIGELKLVDQLMATGWVPEDEDGDE